MRSMMRRAKKRGNARWQWRKRRKSISLLHLVLGLNRIGREIEAETIEKERKRRRS